MFMGSHHFASKHANNQSKAEHANKSSPPAIFMGGPTGPPHKNGGEESQAEHPSQANQSKEEKQTLTQSQAKQSKQASKQANLSISISS